MHGYCDIVSKQTIEGFYNYMGKFDMDRLCGLVVRVPGYRSRGPGSNPGAARFSEK
jgi:hypothetical protein